MVCGVSDVVPPKEVRVQSVQVLLVEDNPGDVLCVRQALAAEPLPIRVRVALDGEQAIQILAETRLKPQLVILNLNLPKVFGLLVLEPTRPDAPVVVFTSSSNPHFLLRVLGVGSEGLRSEAYRSWRVPASCVADGPTMGFGECNAATAM